MANVIAVKNSNGVWNARTVKPPILETPGESTADEAFEVLEQMEEDCRRTWPILPKRFKEHVFKVPK